MSIKKRSLTALPRGPRVLAVVRAILRIAYVVRNSSVGVPGGTVLAAERAILHIAYVVRNPSVGVTRRHRARGGAVRCLRRQIAEMIG